MVGVYKKIKRHVLCPFCSSFHLVIVSADSSDGYTHLIGSCRSNHIGSVELYVCLDCGKVSVSR